MSCFHSGVRNILLAFFKGMEETEYFLECSELHFVYAASFDPNWMIYEEEKCPDSIQDSGTSSKLPKRTWRRREFFLACYELYLLYAASVVPIWIIHDEDKCPESTKESETSY